jgi:hypothetical protein
MTNFNANQSPEAVSPRMPDSPAHLLTIMRQVRLCRSTLGAILDELECGDWSANTFENLAECTIGVTAEIEGLWEAVKQST